MTLKAILFDLDGTLIDTAPDFISSLNQLLSEEQKQLLSEDVIRRTVSNGANALVQLGFPELKKEADFNQLRERLLIIYRKRLSEQSKPFEGISELLQFSMSKHLSWGIVTNKPWIYTEPLLKDIKFPYLSSAVICPDHVTNRKPHPEPLLLACQKIGCKPSEAIYLGDHIRDIEAGKNALMPTIACAYGYIGNDEDIHTWQADHVINHPQETIKLLQQYYSI